MKPKILSYARCWTIASAMICSASVESKDYTIVTFEKIQLSDQFHGEGAGAGDFNKDGHKDVVIGSQWYAGPDFRKKTAFRPVTVFEPKSYSDSFCTYGYDFNGDGWDDILVIDIPGKPAAWYENPKDKEGHWKRFEVYPWIGNESPDFLDIVGNERPELVFNIEGHLGYSTVDWNHPEKEWPFHKVTHAKGAFFVYTHGLGVGDINGDGRKDLQRHSVGGSNLNHLMGTLFGYSINSRLLTGQHKCSLLMSMATEKTTSSLRGIPINMGLFGGNRQKIQKGKLTLLNMY